MDKNIDMTNVAVETLSADELAEKVRAAIIAGATPSTLDELQAAAKGSFLFAKSADFGAYRIYVGKFQGAKVAYLYDDNAKKVWQTKDTKAFYSRIEEKVSREKAYPTKKTV